ncbi:MAG: phosphatidylglycerophosphatase A [Helicobacteraceae bacterium]|nr:phosphatidylglycerophosphatase A [Helicobacteraceae bacterium]
MNYFFITVGYSGLFPKAPGTAGSFVALLIGIPFLAYFGSQTFFGAAVLLGILGVKAIDKYELKTGTHDDKKIVIDELVGLWIALSIAPAFFNYDSMLNFENGMLIQVILSFILFRIYDIKKPSIIGRIDRNVKGGIGVMGDDVIAGFAAGITTAIIWQIILKFI